ncbi:restriction endonuclease subunit S [Candidatus Thiodubiliella endoseptemdiera]|uniref:restriction endonuclease subunit S n=1 Tax=Candidatus Thiodubiliella endoseptemdiera TaxID=2738886 RepID=UPI0034DEB375
MSALLQFVQYKELDNWSVISELSVNYSINFDLVKLSYVLKDLTGERKITIDDSIIYEEPTISSKTNVISVRKKALGREFKVKKRIQIKKNDLVFAKLHTQNGLFAFSNNAFVSTSTFIPCSFDDKKITKEYLFIVLKRFLRYLSSNDSVGRETYKTQDILNLKIPLPPLEIQQQLVKNYQEKLNLAKNQEQQARQKEQEIEGYLYQELGIELPAKKVQNKDILRFVEFKNLQEWGFDFATKTKVNIKSLYSVFKVSDICSIGSGGTPSRDNLDYYKGNIPWVKTTEVRNGYISNTSEKITHEAMTNKNLKLYPKNSLIMAMYGQGLTRGRISKLNIDTTTNQACAVLHKFMENINIDYVWFYLQNEYHNLRALASGNNQPNLNSQKIKTYPIVIPPLEIQNKIANHIQAIKNEIQDLKQQAEYNKTLALKELEAEIFNAS